MVRFEATGDVVLRYNPVLLRENPRRFIQQTVAHEVAHLVARRIHGSRIRPHGREWQAVMREFGVEPRRCHDFDTTRSTLRRLRRFRYHCDCSEHQITTIRHNRVLAGQRYLCRRCGEALRQTPTTG